MAEQSQLRYVRYRAIPFHRLHKTRPWRFILGIGNVACCTFVPSSGLYTRALSWKEFTLNIPLDTPSPSLSTSAQNDIGTYLNSDVDSQLCNELLETYWCWPYHLRSVLCRKIFMRDLTSTGPYVTPYLLNAVLTQSPRYLDHPEASRLGQTFAQRTLDTLVADLDRESSIPTIQGLLISSA